MHPLTLTFGGELEREYRAHYLAQNVPYMRLAGIVATLLWIVFGLTDLLWASPEVLHHSALIRYGIVFPIQVVAILASTIRAWYRVVPMLIALTLIAVAAGLLGINSAIPAKAEIPIEVGFVLLTVASYTFFRLRFFYGVLVSMAILLLTVMNSFVAGISTGRMVYDLSILLVANVFGGFAGFAMEYYERLDFLHRAQSEAEKSRDIEMANLRTAQQLARAIAHEFNNPLHVIRATYELDIKPIQKRSLPPEAESLERIPMMVERMSRLVDNLLDITHLSRRDYVKGVEIIDLHNSSNGDPASNEDRPHHHADDSRRESVTV